MKFRMPVSTHMMNRKMAPKKPSMAAIMLVVLSNQCVAHLTQMLLGTVTWVHFVVPQQADLTVSKFLERLLSCLGVNAWYPELPQLHDLANVEVGLARFVDLLR